jgi:hypothetical protein
LTEKKGFTIVSSIFPYVEISSIVLAFLCIIVQKSEFFYSPSPEYPVACYRGEWRGEPRRSPSGRSRVGYGVILLDILQLAAGNIICEGSTASRRKMFSLARRDAGEDRSCG